MHHKFYPETLPELRTLLGQHLGGFRCVVAQAGHFLICHDESRKELFPCIAEEVSESRLQPLVRQHGAFPLITWKLGLDLLSGLACDKRLIMTVVNDWQHVPKSIRRQSFYQTHRRLPESFLTALASSPKPVELLQPPRRPAEQCTRPYFSEMNQRNQFRRRVDKMLANSLLPSAAKILHTPDGVVCSLPDETEGHPGRAFYCTGKSPDCAAQIAQMLSHAHELSECDGFINIYPLVCRTYVEGGTELAFDLFKAPLSVVANIGIPSSRTGSITTALRQCEVTIHRQNKS